MPSALTLKAMNTVHRVILKASFGKLGWNAGTMPVIELTTKGRKSGELRKVMLTSPLQEGPNHVLVASRGGDDHHPAWFLNLRDEAKVRARIGGGPEVPMLAREATPEERARMWPLVTRTYKGYAGYQAKTDREIPLVILGPA